MMIFLDAVSVAFPATAPLWFSLCTVAVLLGIAGTAGYLLLRQLKDDAAEKDGSQPPERL